MYIKTNISYDEDSYNANHEWTLVRPRHAKRKFKDAATRSYEFTQRILELAELYSNPTISHEIDENDYLIGAVKRFRRDIKNVKILSKEKQYVTPNAQYCVISFCEGCERYFPIDEFDRPNTLRICKQCNRLPIPMVQGNDWRPVVIHNDKAICVRWSTPRIMSQINATAKRDDEAIRLKKVETYGDRGDSDNVSDQDNKLKTKFDTEFIAQIINKRLSKNLTQDELGQLLNVKGSVVRDFERGMLSYTIPLYRTFYKFISS